MDGMTFPLPTERTLHGHDGSMQRTLRSAIGCTGVGVHTGRDVAVRLLPAEAGSGIVFRRTDIGGASVAAQHDRVADTRMCTVLANGDCRVGTVEHLMAALFSAGVDNAVVEVSGPEIPVLDGSSEPWMFLIGCAGTAAQDAPRAVIEVLRTVRVTDGEASAELRPGYAGFEMAMSIEFAAAAIGRQAFSLRLEGGAFRRELARARTFAQRAEIEGLRQAGLALGGSLDNAVVVDGAEILNPAGLRMADEFVRHKLLDAVGDLALAGAPLQGRFIGRRSGHALNNAVLRALFADAANYRVVQQAPALLAA